MAPAEDARKFWWGAGAAAVIGLALRVWWTETHGLSNNAFLGDQFFYHGIANVLADGAGYVDPRAFAHGSSVASAHKPPLYPLVLAAQSKLGGDSVTAHRLLGAVLGTATIIVLALFARRLGGWRVGVATAVILALAPQFWVLNSQMLSETLYGLLIAGALLLAAYDRPTMLRLGLLGVLLGLAALTRPEAVLIAPLIALVLAFRHRRALVKPLAVGAALFIVVISPWIVRNWTVFDRPVPFSVQGDINLAGANCAAAYYGRDTGNWRYDCAARNARGGGDEVRQFARARGKGLEYAKDHLARFPIVALARVGRTWGFYHPTDSSGGDPRHFGRFTALAAWALLASAVLGFVVARRRGVPTGLLLIPPIVITITAVAQFGLLRYRFTADLVFVVMAGFALDALLRLGRRARTRTPEGAQATRW